MKNLVLDNYNYKCNNGGYEETQETTILFDGILENLTLPYYGFYEVKLIKGDREVKGYSNNMFCVNGETREITFETSWLACNGYPNIKITDLMFIRNAPILLGGQDD